MEVSLPKQVRAWGDLALIALAVLGVGAGDLLPQPVRGVSAAVLLVWGLGHLAFEAGWPRGSARVHGRIERQAFAVGLSLTMTPLVAVVLHLANALTPANLQWVLGALLVGLFAATVVRRVRAAEIPPPGQDAATSPTALTSRERVLTALAIAAGIAAVAVVGFRVSILAEPAPMTLALTETNGALPPHPFNVTIGADTAVLAHLAAGRTEAYRITAALDGKPVLEATTPVLEAGRSNEIRIPLDARSEAGPAWLSVEAVGESSGETRKVRLLVEFREGTP